MKHFHVLALLTALIICIAPASAATLYVDASGACGGTIPCYLHPQDAVNAAIPGDTIMVYPGTYGSRVYPDCGWQPNCGCGDTSAPALIVYKNGLTIQATGTAAETIIESTHQCWSNRPPVLKSTNNNVVPVMTAPNGISIIASGVTIDGFTVRSEYQGDPNKADDWPNTAGIMIGALFAGDKPPIGVTGTTVKNCILYGHSGIYNWRASGTIIENNVITILQSPLEHTHNGNGIAVWDGYYEGTFPPTSKGVQILNNKIDTATTLSRDSEGNGIMFGGTDSTNAGADQSDMLIDGNTIKAFTDGIKFWHSIGENKRITCNNEITFGSSGSGYKIWDRSDGPGPASTWTELPCVGTLIVKKIVVNDNGGTQPVTAFSFILNGGEAVPFDTDGVNELTVDVGSYTVTEPAVDGYSTTYSNCENVEIQNGGTATCTITNDDKPGTLIVIKRVINDNGRSLKPENFKFAINGGTAQPFEADGQNDVSVNAGTYKVLEPAVPGYTTTYSNCLNLLIPIGGTATCTITNNDQACPTKPCAKLTACPTCGTKPLKVKFTDSSTGISPGGSWKLDFGDGSLPVTKRDPSNVYYHTYLKAGTYYAKLTVMNACGQGTTSTVTITVKCPTMSSPSMTVTKVEPYKVRVQVTSTGWDSGTLYWGDGMSDPVSPPNTKYYYHTYANRGTYTIRLTIRNDCSTTGVSTTRCVTI